MDIANGMHRVGFSGARARRLQLGLPEPAVSPPATVGEWRTHWTPLAHRLLARLRVPTPGHDATPALDPALAREVV